MTTRKPKFVIVLAGGKGTRMRSAELHKVCFPIDGRAAINRALDVYKGAGIAQPIVVVGALAGQVVETVGRAHEGVLFAYQPEQLGTGNATRIGLRALESLDAEADVLLVAGDRLLEPFVLDWLFDLYYSKGCDMAFLTGPKGRRSDRGHVLLDEDGAALANIEVRDIWQREASVQMRRLVEEGASPLRERISEIIGEHFDERRAVPAFGELWQIVGVERREPTAEEVLHLAPVERTHFEFLDHRDQRLVLTPEQVADTAWANMSIYLVKASALRFALDRLNRDNAQREEYLSDLITILAQARQEGQRRFVVRALKVENPHHVLAFNDPAELLAIEEYFQQRKQPQGFQEMPPGPHYRPIAEWRTAFQTLGTAKEDTALREALLDIYGDQPALIAERQRNYLELLADAAVKLGGAETPVLLVHSPGRANIMGRHVDHQGGHCNLMAIDRQVLMVAHPRPDDHIVLWNTDETRFPSRQFAIGDLLKDLPWEDWMSLVTSEQAQRMVLEASGDWGQYVKAAILRLQKQFPTIKLRGLDLVVYGSIPIAAGLSSSSAVVVATAEATVAVNKLSVFPSQFVDLCGEGEWFVGTRGGAADHAAMVFAQRGKVAQVKFFDFGVQQMVDFPADYRMAICNSRIQARKSGGARDVFNQRVACYRLGFKLIRAFFPQYAPLLQHLRDVNVRALRAPLGAIYRILLRLPERASREELEKLLPADELAPIFATHNPPAEGYPIRGVVLFGLAECERSRTAADLLAKGNVQQFGHLMNTSHNGDRVVVYDEQWQAKPYDYRVSNGYLLDLLEALESGEPERVMAAQLAEQPGAYACSTPEIDLMVDAARRVPGVMGAQLAGAGLGGSMMVLAHRDATEALTKQLETLYYAPRGLPTDISVCTPIGGSGVLLDPRRHEGGL